MDRKRYLELCQQNAVYPKSVFVDYCGTKYHPFELLIGFNSKGQTLNRAILHDVNANSTLQVWLEDVNELDKEIEK
jgi:hypothetical protein